MTFHNTASSSRRLYYVTPDCAFSPIGQLSPGATTMVRTYAGAAYAFGPPSAGVDGVTGSLTIYDGEQDAWLW